jgi:hypothetical protein
MPSFTIDVSNYAQDYVAGSVKGKGGNAGQDSLLSSLIIDCNAFVTVRIAGDEVDTTAEGNIKFESSHPEAIEQILSGAEDTFQEFLSKLEGGSDSPYNGLDIIQTIRQLAIDEAFDDL